jgi:AraC-like DNA-binding protein
LDKIAPESTVVLAHVAGFSSERSRALWWHVHDAAHQRCGRTWGCDRRFYPGHQIMFMLTGHGHGTYDRTPWRASAHDAVLMDLRTPHTYYSDPADPWEMLWIRFDGPGVSEIFTRMIAAAGSPVIPFASEKKVRADFAAIFRLFTSHSAGYDAWAWHHVTGLVANVTEGLQKKDTVAGATLQHTPGGITAALSLLRSDHTRTLALSELARTAHMSPFHFSRRFKQSTGFTPMEYLEKFRISRAQEMVLSQPGMSFKEIANASGFTDPAYFSRIFRKRTGVSPREYRRNLGKVH